MATVAIIGYGWVGRAMEKLFPYAEIYDSQVATPHQEHNSKLYINECDIAFICVPTPNKQNGTLNSSIVEDCIKWCTCPLIVVRSTVNPGDCFNWTVKYKKNIVMQPEYLGETPNHPFLDPKTRPFLILGGSKENTRKLIDLYTTVYNANVTIRQVTSLEAEVIKLTENRAIAFKVAQCQELYDVCEKAGVDYYTIRDAVYGDDPRFNLWWTFVFPDKRGFNSKCIPKDVYAWAAWAESVGYDPKLTSKLLEVNKEYLTNSSEGGIK
jgi:UDPglucose 6-dehydrogenase